MGLSNSKAKLDNQYLSTCGHCRLGEPFMPLPSFGNTLPLADLLFSPQTVTLPEVGGLR